MSEEYGPDSGHTNLFNTIRFSEAFPESRIVHALSEQLSWTHLRQIIYLEDPAQREFYTPTYRIERWSTGTHQDKIQGMLYERTAIGKRSHPLTRQEIGVLRDEDRVSPDLVFRDPCLPTFLGLKDVYTENDFETAILREVEFLPRELGSDFGFVARRS